MVFIREEIGGGDPGEAPPEAVSQWIQFLLKPLYAGLLGREVPPGRFGPRDRTRKEEEEIKENVEQIKSLLPYLALLGGILLFNRVKAKGLPKSVDYLAISNVIGAFAPIITAFGWFWFSKVNDNAKLMSYIFATAETIPTIDLNLPQGINLGAYFSVGEEMAEMIGWDGSIDKEEVLDLTEEALVFVYNLFRPSTWQVTKDIVGE